jgi:hypothetical protein
MHPVLGKPAVAGFGAGFFRRIGALGSSQVGQVSLVSRTLPPQYMHFFIVIVSLETRCTCGSGF